MIPPRAAPRSGRPHAAFSLSHLCRMAREITVQELARKQAAREPIFLLDVRQPDEHAYAALADSTLIPLPELASRHRELKPPAGADLVVYCHHGIRSRRAANFLEQVGFARVWSLAGGIDAWSILIDQQVPRY